MKKLAMFTLSLVFVSILLFGESEITAYAQSSDYNTDKSIISPQAAIIEWRYKAVDGKLYRRQYNCTTSKWIGEWELVP